MFSKFTSLIATALVASGVANLGLAAPASNSPQAREQQAIAEVQVCTAVNFQGCVTIPVNSPDCIDFTEGLSFLDDESSAAVIPDGFVCTFYDNFGCLSAPGGADVVVLQGGSWTFGAGGVTGTRGAVAFNDRASSFICSPV